jgi:hypothetical protein
MTPFRIQTEEERRANIDKLLSTTRYAPPDSFEVDEYGMPILEPEPEDPDDE